jgi:hypothetical protein
VVSKDFQIKWYQSRLFDQLLERSGIGASFWRVLQVVVVMISESLVGEDLEGSYQENKMSKVIMKLRL